MNFVNHMTNEEEKETEKEKREWQELIESVRSGIYNMNEEMDKKE